VLMLFTGCAAPALLQHLHPCGAWQWPLVARPAAVSTFCSRLRAQDHGVFCTLDCLQHNCRVGGSTLALLVPFRVRLT
jgi:hypothetical protein